MKDVHWSKSCNVCMDIEYRDFHHYIKLLTTEFQQFTFIQHLLPENLFIDIEHLFKTENI